MPTNRERLRKVGPWVQALASPRFATAEAILAKFPTAERDYWDAKCVECGRRFGNHKGVRCAN